MHECVNNVRDKKHTADRHKLLIKKFFQAAELKCYFVYYIVLLYGMDMSKEWKRGDCQKKL